MALMPTKWEQEKMREEDERREKAKAQRKKDFIEKWISATPTEQAEILFEISERITEIGSVARNAAFHHITF